MQFNHERTYGIEIEMSWGRGASRPESYVVREALRAAGLRATAPGYSHTTTPSWKVVPDGSVNNGWELVSPILSGLDGKEQLKTAMRVVKEIGATTSRSCGVHIHHGVHDFDAKQLANIAEIYKNNEEVIDALVSPSRRGNNLFYCQSMDNGVEYHEEASERHFQRLEVPWNPPRREDGHPSDTLKNDLIYKLAPYGRYYKVNFASYLRQGTVEFRQHHSSLNANKIWAWIVFTQMIVEAAKAKRGKAKRRVVNSGNPLTAKERGMILDLRMHNLIDPWSGEENYDDITMSALRYLAKKRESSEGGNIGFAHPVRFGGGVTGDRQRAGNEEPDAIEAYEPLPPLTEGCYEPPPVIEGTYEPDPPLVDQQRFYDEEAAYDEGPREGQPGASLPTAQEIHNGQMDNGDDLPW